MTDTRYDYRIYCKTESKWVEGTTKSKPTACFNNDSHVIESSATTLLNTISPTIVTLKEEEFSTNGNYKCDGVALSCAPNTTTYYDIEYPFPINLMSASTTVTDDHIGNTLNVYFVPDSIIGGMTQVNGPNLDKVVMAGLAEIQNIFVGLDVTISDSEKTESLGTIQSIDANTLSFTVADEPTKPYTRGSAVKASYTTRTGTLTQTLLPFNKIKVVDASDFIVGLSITISGISVGVVTAVDYVNNIITVASNISAGYISGSVVDCAFSNINRATTADVAINNTTINVDSSGLVVGINASITDGVNTFNLGALTAVGETSVTVSNPSTYTFLSGATITFSHSCSTTLSQAHVLSTKITINSELTAFAFIGLRVTVGGNSIGAVTAINSNTLTLSGTANTVALSGTTVSLSFPDYTLLTTEDCLPSNYIEVSDTAVVYAQVGMAAKITNSSFTQNDELGRIISVDKINKRLRIETPPTRNYAPGSYISVTRFYIQNLEFSGRGTYNFSNARNKGSYVDVGKIGRIAYTNRTNQTLKFSMKLEYLH